MTDKQKELEKMKKQMLKLEKEIQTEPKKIEVTIDDIMKAAVRVNQEQTQTDGKKENKTMQPKTTELTKVAKLVMNAEKTITNLSIMLMIIPIISVMVSMAGQATIGAAIALIGVMYPAIKFAMSMNNQKYLAIKYKLQPSFLLRNQFKQMQMAQKQPKPKKSTEGEFI